MSPTCNGSTVLQHLECSNTIEIHNGIPGTATYTKLICLRVEFKPLYMHMYTEFHFLEVFLKLLILYVYVHFYWELALKLELRVLNPLRVHGLCHAHSLASLQRSGLSDH